MTVVSLCLLLLLFSAHSFARFSPFISFPSLFLSLTSHLLPLHHAMYRCSKTIRSSYQMHWQKHLVHKKCTIPRSICRLLTTFGDILWCIFFIRKQKKNSFHEKWNQILDEIHIENALAIDMLTLTNIRSMCCVYFIKYKLKVGKIFSLWKIFNIVVSSETFGRFLGNQHHNCEEHHNGNQPKHTVIILLILWVCQMHISVDVLRESHAMNTNNFWMCDCKSTRQSWRQGSAVDSKSKCYKVS